MNSKKIAIKFMVITALVLPIGSLPGKTPLSFDAVNYLTPDCQYSNPGKCLANKYMSQLVAMGSNIKSEIATPRFEFIDVNRSKVGGIGFWVNPNSGDPDIRYLGVAARVNIKCNNFPDNDWGRMGDALDAFGKDLFKIMGTTLNAMPDANIRGIAVVMIYSKAEMGDPAYYDQAESFVIFIPRESLQKFNSFSLSMNQLFEQSDTYSFRSKDQIQMVFTDFLRG